MTSRAKVFCFFALGLILGAIDVDVRLALISALLLLILLPPTEGGS